jgi:hypothetical protein
MSSQEEKSKFNSEKVDISLERKKELLEYRNQINQLESKNQEGFDKTLLTLSSGALGLTLTFIKDIIDLDNAKFTVFLFLCWLSWALSLCMILLSYNSSISSFQKIRMQIDRGEVDTILKSRKHLGEPFRTWTSIFNHGGLITFLIGVLFIIIFISLNLEVI